MRRRNSSIPGRDWSPTRVRAARLQVSYQLEPEKLSLEEVKVISIDSIRKGGVIEPLLALRPGANLKVCWDRYGNVIGLFQEGNHEME